MKRYSRLKLKRSIKLSYVIMIVLFLIVFNVIFLFSIFNKKINTKIIKVANMDVDKIIDNIVTEYSLKEDYDTIKDILIISKNKNDEIIDVSFDLKKVYNFSSHITEQLKSDLYDLKKGNTAIDFNDEYLLNDKEYFVLLIPMGILSDNTYFSNMGPKIPVKIKFIGNLYTNVKTKITDYGINNSLIEVYTTIDISTLIITPVASKRVKRSYDVLIASKIIEGKVPDIYGGIYEKNSNIIKKEINK